MPGFTRRECLKAAVASLAAACVSPLFSDEIREKTKTILLISGWQDINIGDITHTTGMLAILRRHLPDAKIILWKSRFEGEDSPAVVMIRKHFPEVKIIHGGVDKAKHALGGEDLLKAVAEADIFVHGSGPSVARHDALDAWMHMTEKPFGIFGTTIGGVSAELKPILEKAAFVFTRETASLEVLKKHGLEGEHIRFVPDATFALDTRDDATAQAFLDERGLKTREFICVIPRLRYTPYPGRLEKNPHMRDVNEAKKEPDHAKAREAMIAWVEKTGLPVLVCPEMTYQVEIMDELLVRPLPAAVKRLVQTRGYWMPDEAASVYAQAHTVLSFECHSPIIATAMGTPAFYLRQPEDTIKGRMYYDLGMTDRVFEIEDTAGRQIADRLLEIVEDYPAALAKVRAVNTLTEGIYAKAAGDVKSAAGEGYFLNQS